MRFLWDMCLQLLVVFLSSSFISLILTPLVIIFYTRKGWLDTPDKKHKKNIHQYPVPRGGGIVIFFSVLFSCLLFLNLDKHLIGVLVGALIIFIMGFLDDIYDINPYLRLGCGFLAATVVVGFGVGIPFITNPLGGIIQLNQPQIAFKLFGRVRTIWVLADLFALFWIVWCMNFVNWSKGLDGQLPGIVVIAAFIIAVFSLRFSNDSNQWPVILISLIVSGAYLGFLPWNFYPQKIMPGYGGGALAGYFLAVLTIFSNTKVGTGILVLAVPFLDALWAIFRRIRSGKSPVWGDSGHLHHRLIKAGWTKKKIAFFYWGLSGITGFLALILNSQAKLYTIVLLTFIFIGFILWLKFLNRHLFLPDQTNG